jgi:hypothetical protein
MNFCEAPANCPYESTGVLRCPSVQVPIAEAFQNRRDSRTRIAFVQGYYGTNCERSCPTEGDRERIDTYSRNQGGIDGDSAVKRLRLLIKGRLPACQP